MRTNSLEWFLVHFILGYIVVYTGIITMNVSRMLEISNDYLLTWCIIAFMVSYGLRKQLKLVFKNESQNADEYNQLDSHRISTV